MPPLAYYLAAFAVYTISIILLTGQSFPMKESVRSFYLGNRAVPLWPTAATFCATWISPLSLVGFSMWYYRDGWVAFWSSVNGWMLGFLFFPFIVKRLRMARVMSMPEWLEKSCGDVRVRRLAAAAMIFLYTVYLVIQFRAFGVIVSYMLQIPQGFASTSLIYLFVLYTTFGGYPSVVRSDSLNLLLIIIGVSAAAYFALPGGFTLSDAAEVLRSESLRSPPETMSAAEIFSSFAVMLTWGFGVAANPQYAVRIIACRSRREAFRLLSAAPYIIGWIYLCVSFFVMVCRVCHPDIGVMEETLGFAVLGQFLPPFASMLLLVCVIASAVSTANSQLLLAACSLCYDLFPRRAPRGGVFGDERFLIANRAAVTVIASAALLLGTAELPGYMRLGSISWTLVAILYFYPLFTPRLVVREILFSVLLCAVAAQLFLIFVFGLEPEYAMLAVMAGEGLVFALRRRAREASDV
ncbi:sodium:solute symporter family protein [Cloacibacillus sp. An23]|uniref:sodium:solute symporter family protein n=1 Tax=Cloacibacillus sp. An23 TaxID=1965591 RepID=UPI000B38B766|nr:sodium:solute symporter family protein [Cloacibacillus sp. An23]OUO91603.1 hypothetical protein B5F39_12740 [Cloacibacillus sp. An23]